MKTAVTQRWRNGRDAYRPSGETINTSRYDVSAISDDTTAKSFVQRHHYSGTYPAARFRFGLYEREQLVGVAVYSVPANPRCLDVLPCDRIESVELGRFVLLDHVPANAETWFLGRCHRLLVLEGVRGVVSFSDPVPRTTVEGRLRFRGHIGTIYQAHNAVYLGQSKAETKRLLPDGLVLHGRGLAKIRKRDKGYRAAARVLERYGAEPLREDEDARAWVKRWAERLTRPFRHEGNHKYAWGLTRIEKRHMPDGAAYPKFDHGVLACP